MCLFVGVKGIVMMFNNMVEVEKVFGIEVVRLEDILIIGFLIFFN